MTEKQALKRLAKLLGPRADLRIVDNGPMPTKAERESAREFLRLFRAAGEPPEERAEAKRQATIVSAKPRFQAGQSKNVLGFGQRFDVAGVGDTLREAVLHAESSRPKG